MSLLIVNDVHLGAVRSAGTTLTTRGQITDYLQDAFRNLILQHPDKDLLIAGDLFDSFNVDNGQIIRAYITLDEWLRQTGKRLHLKQGNHDIAKNSDKTSSFAFLCKLLQVNHPHQVLVYTDGLAQIQDKVYVIPHVVNSDLFDLELAEALLIEPGYLVLHANCMNKFAEHADHSLNVNEEWVDKLVAHGHTLVFAHEHQARKLKGGKVLCMGNQFPSSVADCLTHGDAQKDGRKFAHIISDNDTLHTVETWHAAGDYVAMPWNDLQPSDCRFIRIEGTATADQAADVINAIAKYRQSSKAFVITNSVNIAGIEGMSDMATLNSEKIEAVDVLEALCQELTEPEAAKVRELLKGEQ